MTNLIEEVRTNDPTAGLEIYQVGGSVRDEMLDLPIKDRDYVVVGANTRKMLDRGFKQVGKDFPVFLHPKTSEEYALARSERKTGPGYHGFAVDAGEHVTLEQDLLRRDLTINAMARDSDGRLIDPFGGQTDLAARKLRHVSEAFAEDPVRILRLARFAARFAPLGFQPAEETVALMRQMVTDGEVDALVPERVWQETERALGEARPGTFITVLRACDALQRIFPEIDALFGVPQPAQHHPEIDTGVHTTMVVDAAAMLAPGRSDVGYAALTHDLGKALTPEDQWPSHRGHEKAGLEPLKAMNSRLRVPRNTARLAQAVCEQHLHAHRALELKPGSVMRLIEAVDGLRSEDRWEAFLLACEADARGRTGYQNRPYPQADFLRQARAAAASQSPQDLLAKGLSGAELGERLRQQRIMAIKKVAVTHRNQGEH